MAVDVPPSQVRFTENFGSQATWNKWFESVKSNIDSNLASIITDHTGLSNIGSNTHAQIDTFIANHVIGTNTQAWDADLDTIASNGETAYYLTDGTRNATSDHTFDGSISIQDATPTVGTALGIDTTSADSVSAVQLVARNNATSIFKSAIALDLQAEYTGTGAFNVITGAYFKSTINSNTNLVQLYGAKMDIKSINSTTGGATSAYGCAIDSAWTGTGTISNSHGVYIADIGDASNVTSAYGVKIDKQTSTSTAHGLWLANDGIGADTTWGQVKDAGIYYDGTNLVIDPAYVGTGYLDVLSAIHADAFVMNTQQTYTLNATSVVNRTLLASASATTINNNNVLAGLITDLKTAGLIA